MEFSFSSATTADRLRSSEYMISFHDSRLSFTTSSFSPSQGLKPSNRGFCILNSIGVPTGATGALTPGINREKLLALGLWLAGVVGASRRAPGVCELAARVPVGKDVPKQAGAVKHGCSGGAVAVPPDAAESEIHTRIETFNMVPGAAVVLLGIAAQETGATGLRSQGNGPLLLSLTLKGRYWFAAGQPHSATKRVGRSSKAVVQWPKIQVAG